VRVIGRAPIKFYVERGTRFPIHTSGPGKVMLAFMPEAEHGTSNAWLTCVVVDPDAFGADREAIRLALEAEDIEGRPLWKPMHLQPVFASHEVYGGDVGARLFDRGLCLPSGSALTDEEQDRVVATVLAARRPRV